jgi:hypothetical protein
MRTANGVRPTRNAKIDGVRYELKAVGVNVYGEAKAILDAVPPRHIDGRYTYRWSETDHGSPCRVKSATKDQLAKWPELAAYREKIDAIRATPRFCPIEWMREWPSLLWIKV